MMNRLAVMIMAVLIVQAVYAQEPPTWIDETWRNSDYPHGKWYVGFAQDALKPNDNVDERLNKVERTALNRMFEAITVRLSGTATLENTSVRTNRDGVVHYASSSDYRQMIETYTSAGVVNNIRRESWTDPKTGTIYALAAVRKSDLEKYYESQANYNLKLAGNAVGEARKLTQYNEKSDALKKYDVGGKNLDTCAQYLGLLSAVGYAGGKLRSLSDSLTALRNDIVSAVAELGESMSFYVVGAETIDGVGVDIVTSKLKSVISKSYRLAANPTSAGYTMRVDVSNCNVTTPPGNRTFCHACVKIETTNRKTGQSEVVDTTWKGSSSQGREAACRDAFRKAAEGVSGIKIFR